MIPYTTLLSIEPSLGPILGKCGGLEEVHVDYSRVSYHRACLTFHTPNCLFF